MVLLSLWRAYESRWVPSNFNSRDLLVIAALPSACSCFVVSLLFSSGYSRRGASVALFVKFLQTGLTCRAVNAIMLSGKRLIRSCLFYPEMSGTGLILD